MKKILQQRNERLFNKLFENQGIKIQELDVAQKTAWQAIEEEEELEEEETLEEVHAHGPDQLEKDEEEAATEEESEEEQEDDLPIA